MRPAAPEILKASDSRNLSTRKEALSVLFAKEAEQDSGVTHFRATFLNDQLLRPQQIKDWISEQAAEDGDPTFWLDVPLPSGLQLKLSKNGRIFTEPVLRLNKTAGAAGRHLRLLDYAIEGSDWTHCIPTTDGGVLDRLRLLSEQLAKRYAWLEAQASFFVLTGGIPLVAIVRSQVRASTGFPPARINLEVDPAVTPRQLAERYRKLRRSILPKRSRSISEKHLRLAIFVANCSPDSTWKQRLADWNRQHAVWKYKNDNYFRRDALQVKKRLLQSGISLRSVLEEMTKD